MIIKFNEDSLEYIEEPLDLGLVAFYSRAAYSDRHTGELIFASNGWRLINRNGEILSNKLYRDEIPHPGGTAETTEVLVPLGPLFLDDPGDSTKVYLFYGEYQLVNSPFGTFEGDTHFSYAYLDIPSQSLISQVNPVLDELTTKGSMAATRHANGRDWWLIKPSYLENRIYIGLLDPNGISMEEIVIEGIEERIQFSTFSQFSFDGSRFFHYGGWINRTLYTYDFDRCTGSLSNRETHDLRDSLRAGDFNVMALSPDASKVYFKRGGYFFPNVQIQGVLQYDVYTQESYLIPHSSAPLLSPNGKTILLQTSTPGIGGPPPGQRYLSEIMQPNEFGEACSLALHKYPIGTNAAFAMNSCYANHMLGALEGSGCDTLGVITNKVAPEPQKGMLIYPNPAKDEMHIRVQDSPQGMYSLKIYTLLGATVYQQEQVKAEVNLKLHELALKGGLYFIEMKNNTSSTTYKQRFVYAH